MKKTLKKLFKSILITTVTLLSGFGITSISFNLFGTLTANEMKLFLAIDVIILVFVGGVFYYIDENMRRLFPGLFQPPEEKQVDILIDRDAGTVIQLKK